MSTDTSRGRVPDSVRIAGPFRRPLINVLIAVALSCTSRQGGVRPPTPDESAVLDALKQDSSAVTACAKRTLTAAEGRVYSESEVDKHAMLLSRPPELPRSDGDAVAVVVVRPTGRADPRSVTVVRATSFELGNAVLSFGRRAEYQPAELGGRPVAQCLILPLTVRTRP